jgi:ribosomal protein S18 acetylase RimI-like enzyme
MSAARVSIRPALAADHATIAALALEVLEHHVAAVPDVFQPTAGVLPEAYYDELLNDPEAGVRVAERAGTIAGFAVLQLRPTTLPLHVPRTIAYVREFGVAQAARRGGVGRALLAACAAWGRERYAGTLELDCWEANQAGIAFYTAQGMRVTRRSFALDL